MGKATIISETGAGRYTVRINKDISRITVRIARLTARVAALTAELVSQAAQITYQNEVIASLTAQISIATLEQLPALEKSLLEARTELDKLNVTKRLTELERVSCQKTIDYLNGLSGLADETVGAWCADYTEDLTGIVGTMEVPGERGTVLVRPGYNGAATYSAARDGQLQPVLAGTPASAYWNYCMFPGWQKWKPLWRFGRIVSLSGNLATVDLDSVTSSAQALDINQTNANLTSVPIEYMDCNGGAFIVGDDVVVEFTDQDWAQPKVVGFREGPRPCIPLIWVEVPNNSETWVTVYNLETGAVATGLKDPSTGNDLTFPCLKTTAQAWYNGRTLPSPQYNLFNVATSYSIRGSVGDPLPGAYRYYSYPWTWTNDSWPGGASNLAPSGTWEIGYPHITCGLYSCETGADYPAGIRYNDGTAVGGPYDDVSYDSPYGQMIPEFQNTLLSPPSTQYFHNLIVTHKGYKVTQSNCFLSLFVGLAIKTPYDYSWPPVNNWNGTPDAARFYCHAQAEKNITSLDMDVVAGYGRKTAFENAILQLFAYCFDDSGSLAGTWTAWAAYYSGFASLVAKFV